MSREPHGAAKAGLFEADKVDTSQAGYARHLARKHP